MTIWIMAEFDREGWAVCLFWLQGGKHNETPTDEKNSSIQEHPWKTLAPTFQKGRKKVLQVPWITS